MRLVKEIEIIKMIDFIIKKLKIIYKYSVSFVFIIAIIIPILFINTESDKISQGENRFLANMPKLFDENGEFVFVKQEYEKFFNDNIGFRKEFTKLSASINYNIFNKSPLTFAQFGKDDWIFFATDDNLEIAYGEYPLTVEQLENLATEQETIYNILKLNGIEYALILPPSKVSVYPEKLNENLEIIKTPSDILADYIEENTNVPVIRLKQTLINEKENHQLYYKTDTHWTYISTNIAAQKIAQEFYNLGYIQNNYSNVQFDFKEIDFYGDMIASMPNFEYLEPEKVNEMYLTNAPFEKVEHPLIQEIIDNRDMNKYVSYNNETASNDVSFLLYSDSMFADRARGDSLAGYFTELDIIRFDYIYNQFFISDILELNPDIVAVSVTERLISRLVHGFVDYEINKVNYTELPINSNEEITIYLDYFRTYVDGVMDININTLPSDSLIIDGWAIDNVNMLELSDVYVQIGDDYYNTNYGKESQFLASHFNNENYANAKFAVNIDVNQLRKDNINEIYIIAVSKDGTYQYEKIKCNLIW